jgi:hypothetical protein
MKIFTDATETSFFTTDRHIKNLHKIEINTIKEFVFKYGLDSDILIGEKAWMISRFDELVSGEPLRVSEEEMAGEWLEIDFTQGMSVSEIEKEVDKYVER